MAWLITGGAGYIGAHIVRAFLEADTSLVVLDNLSTGIRERVPKNVPFVEGSVLDAALLDQIMENHEVIGVVHAAGKKSVPESLSRPDYYELENVEGTRTLVEACKRQGVRHFVFSSSAAVYGVSDAVAPIGEDAPPNPINPYGQSKLDAERVIEKAAANGDLDAVVFRYFNVGGAASPLLEDVLGANLIPVARRAVSESQPVHVFGTQLPTRDGSCIRDYIHVQDIAEAHLAAAQYLQESPRAAFEVMNLGSGSGSTVLEVLDAIGRAEGTDVAWVSAPPRPGDPVASTCDASRAEQLLGWHPTRGLGEIVSRTS